jgi:hypothetical protein
MLVLAKDLKLTRAAEQCLRDQEITLDKPGSILHDFRIILDVVGLDGVEAGGKYNLLPLKFIGDLDEKLSRPLRLNLKRPQLRSHPYVQGLNLLLRASGLSRVEGAGAKARLVIDRGMFEQWDSLNETERYFNLLDAWLRFGRAEMVGEKDGLRDSFLSSVFNAWQVIPEEGCQFDVGKPEFVYVRGVDRDFYLVALMDLFGLLKIKQPPPQTTPWIPAGLERVPFGDAVFTLIASRSGRRMMDHLADEEDQGDGPMTAHTFGAWQALFRPYFPEWEENLCLPESEIRDGTFIFRVSLGNVWRQIAMPADLTLGDFVGWILRSVNFDHDHLYRFTFSDRMGVTVSASHPDMDDRGPCADEIPIGSLPLEPGQTMELLYDFGDEWHFDVKLERIAPPSATAKAPRVVEKNGKAPKQYPDWDE